MIGVDHDRVGPHLNLGVIYNGDDDNAENRVPYVSL